MAKTVPAALQTIIASEYMTLSTAVKIELRNFQPKPTAITAANPAAVTTDADHLLTTGDSVIFRDVEGMVELEGLTGVITVTAPTTFTVDIDAGGFTAFAVSSGTTRSNKVFGFCDHDLEFLLDSVTYEPSFAYTPTTTDNSSNLAVDNVELRGIIDSEGISEADLLAGTFDYAKLELFMYNNLDITDGVIILKRGQLGEVQEQRDIFFAEFRGLAAHLVANTIRTYMPGCSARLGDARCGFAIATLEVAGTVTVVTSRRKFEDTSLSDVDAYFDGGVVRWTAGNNSGKEMEVRDYLLADPTNPSVVLLDRMVADIQVGDTYTLIPGCNKSLGICLSKFDNVINFRGFPHLPGQAELFDYLKSGRKKSYAEIDQEANTFLKNAR